MKKIVVLSIAIMCVICTNAQKEISMSELVTKPMLIKCDLFTSSLSNIQKELNKSKAMTKRMDFMLDDGEEPTLSNYVIHGSEYQGAYIRGLKISDSENKRNVTIMFAAASHEVAQTITKNMVTDLKYLGFSSKNNDENNIYLGDVDNYEYVCISSTDNMVRLSFEIIMGSMPLFK